MSPLLSGYGCLRPTKAHPALVVGWRVPEDQ